MQTVADVGLWMVVKLQVNHVKMKASVSTISMLKVAILAHVPKGFLDRTAQVSTQVYDTDHRVTFCIAFDERKTLHK